MRRRTLQEIQRCEQTIRLEGFGLASVAREGAAEVRELAGYMRRLRPGQACIPRLRNRSGKAWLR